MKANVLTRSRKLKAEELYRAGNLLEADELYASVSKADKTDVNALVMRCVINRKMGRAIEAEGFGSQAIKLSPGSYMAHHARGAALQVLGRLDEAMNSYQRALQLKPDNAETHYFLANVLKEIGRHEEAEASYRAAISIQPTFVEALGNLGILLTLMGKLDAAADMLNRAAKINPNSHQLQSAIGRVLLRERRTEEAIVRYQMAMRLNPSADVASELAVPLEKSNRIEEARALVECYLPMAPNDPQLLLVAARLARRENKFAEALDMLLRAEQQPQGPESLSEILILAGQIHDRLGNAGPAFEKLRHGNLLQAQIDNKQSEGQAYFEKLEKIHGYLTPDLEGMASPLDNEVNQGNWPIFVFGFPRSGTTLLEQILDSHPRLQAMEEKGAVDVMFARFEELAREKKLGLAGLDTDDIQDLRKAYFGEVDRHVDRKPGLILVDRMPLNTIYAHLIWRVFPQSKMVLAIRHPCDVCLSCFMQNFAANLATINFYTLESSAETYVKVMSLWQDYASKLPLSYHRIRYEDLVADFEEETRKLLEYLDVGWHDDVRNHTQHAINRGQIRTASYHQVVQPLYQHAKYRWKRYEAEFEPIMPALKPFVSMFGYQE